MAEFKRQVANPTWLTWQTRHLALLPFRVSHGRHYLRMTSINRLFKFDQYAVSIAAST
jgi:hypothetical protein